MHWQIQMMLTIQMIGKQESGIVVANQNEGFVHGGLRSLVHIRGIMPGLPTGEHEVLLSSRMQGVHLPNKHFNLAMKLTINGA